MPPERLNKLTMSGLYSALYEYNGYTNEYIEICSSSMRCMKSSAQLDVHKSEYGTTSLIMKCNAVTTLNSSLLPQRERVIVYLITY